MFGFIVDDIIGYADYVLWNNRIKRVNQEYHQKYDYTSRRGLCCQKCDQLVVNWRQLVEGFHYLYLKAYDHRICLHERSTGHKIPKNY